MTQFFRVQLFDVTHRFIRYNAINFTLLALKQT